MRSAHPPTTDRRPPTTDRRPPTDRPGVGGSARATGATASANPAHFDRVGILRAARRRIDASQRELALLVGVGASTIERAELPDGGASLPLIQAILGLAGLRLAVLDADGRELRPEPADVTRDLGGRRYPAHLDVWPLSRIDHPRGGPRYDRPVSRATYEHRPHRDLRRREHCTPSRHPTATEMAFLTLPMSLRLDLISRHGIPPFYFEWLPGTGLSPDDDGGDTRSTSASQRATGKAQPSGTEARSAESDDAPAPAHAEQPTPSDAAGGDNEAPPAAPASGEEQAPVRPVSGEDEVDRTWPDLETDADGTNSPNRHDSGSKPVITRKVFLSLVPQSRGLSESVAACPHAPSGDSDTAPQGGAVSELREGVRAAGGC